MSPPAVPPPDQDPTHQPLPTSGNPSQPAVAALADVEMRTAAVRDLLGYEPFGLTAPDALRAVMELGAEVDRLLSETVQQARRDGTTWQDIGTVLGISRQAAFQRFGQAQGPTPPAGKATRRNMAALVGLAEQIFARCADGNWGVVRDHFNPVMAEAVTEENLSSVWTAVVAAVGTYEQPGTVSTRKNGALQIVDMELVFEAGEMAGRIAFDGNGKVAGMLILDPSMLPG